MTRNSSRISSSTKNLYSIVITGVMLYAYVCPLGMMAGFDFTFPLGTVYAIEESQQKEVEHSANDSGSGHDGRTLDGMDTVTDLLEGKQVTREFRDSIEVLLDDVRKREEALSEREKALELVQRDITQKLNQLRDAREQLNKLTKKIDQEREEELAVAVKKYKAMDAKLAAKFFNQMDLEFVAPVLKRMDTRTGGGILDEMVNDAEQGTPAEVQVKLAKLKELGEYLVDPLLKEAMAAELVHDVSLVFNLFNHLLLPRGLL